MVQAHSDSSAPILAGKSICITSRRPGEGKTSVAIRLAGALARCSLRVCLVDFGSGADGLSARFAQDQLRSDAAAVAVAPSVDLIPAPVRNGVSVAEDAAIVRLAEMLDRLKPAYDLILLDCGSDLLGWCYPLWRRMDAVIAVVCPDTMTPDLAWSVAAWIGHPDISALFLLNKAGPGGEDIGRLEGVAAGIGRMRFGGSPVVLGQLFRDDRVAELAVAAAFGEGRGLPDSGMDHIVGELLLVLERKPPPEAAVPTPAPAVGSGATGSHGRFVQELAEGFVAEGVFLDHVGQLLAAYRDGFGLTPTESLRRLVLREAEPNGVAELIASLGDASGPTSPPAGDSELSLENLPEDAVRALYEKLEDTYRRRFDKELHDSVANLVARIGAPGYRKEQFSALHRTLLRAYAQRFGKPYREVKAGGSAESAAGAAVSAGVSSVIDRANTPATAAAVADAGSTLSPSAATPAAPLRSGHSVRRVPSSRAQWALVTGTLGLAVVALGLRLNGESLSVQAPQVPKATRVAAAKAPTRQASLVAEAPVTPEAPPEPVITTAAQPLAHPLAVAPIAVAAAAVRADQPEPSRLAAGPEGESPPAAAGAAEANGLERLWVEAREDCWVSVSDRRGHVLGRDLLKGGVARTYVGAGPLHVMLGNSTAVTVRVNDVPVDLAPYQRHRVAHLTLPDIRRPAAQPVASME